MGAASDLIQAANTIASERRRRGLTQDALGAAVGRSQPTIAKLEGVHQAPEPLVTFFRIAAELGLRVKLEPAQ